MKVIVHLMGGLGNQMFQYALGRRLNHDRAADLLTFFEDKYTLANRAFGLENFQVISRHATAEELRQIGPERKIRRRLKTMMGMKIERHVVREKVPFMFDPLALEIRDRVYLIGFWQSFRYFDSIRDALLADFKLKSSTPAFQRAVDLVSRSERASVSVHIRRTDYLNPASGFQPLQMSYYRPALELIRNKVVDFQLFVFSDDPAWAQKELKEMGYGSATVISGNGLSDAEELMVMSKCRHHVIANSSFSWWAAWLNSRPEKTIVAPASWNGKDTSIPVQDLIPSEWKTI